MQTKTILRYDRLRLSVNGNPRFRFVFTDGSTFDGTSDAAWAYAIGNPDMREGSTVDIELTKANRIRIMRPAR